MEHFVAKVWGCWSLLASVLVLASAVVGKCGCFVAVDGKLYERLTKDAGFKGPASVSRNASGTRLFLTGQTADGGTLVEIVSQQGVMLKRFAARRLVVDDEGELIAWVTNLQATASGTGVVKKLAFTTGDEISIVSSNAFPASFEFSPGGEYLLLRQPRSPAGWLPSWGSGPQPVPFLTPLATNMDGYSPACQAVFRARSPRKPLFLLPNDFYANGIFDRNNRVIISGFKFVFGTGSKPGRPGLEKNRACALVFSDDGSTYTLAGQLDLSRFSGVLDVDSTSGILLVRGKGEKFANWGLFDPESGKYKSLGHAGAHGFFLDHEFSKYLENRWN